MYVCMQASLALGLGHDGFIRKYVEYIVRVCSYVGTYAYAYIHIYKYACV